MGLKLATDRLQNFKKGLQNYKFKMRKNILQKCSYILAKNGMILGSKTIKSTLQILPEKLESEENCSK